MNRSLDGTAIIYCEGAYNTTNGKTAHGLIRFTNRYNILAVVDSRYAGQDAGEVIDGKQNKILIYSDINEAYSTLKINQTPATHLVIGLTPDGGRLSHIARADIKEAIKLGLNIDSGLHDFLSEDPELVKLAKANKIKFRDIRKIPSRDKLHFFSGKIEQVNCLKIAILGTDSAIGKRTTGWILINALNNEGYRTEMVGTGQTSWMQGAKYVAIFDSIVNDFVAGEIEHAVWSVWNDAKSDIIVIEGQGSLMNPAYPGGFEILAAGRPDIVVLQHAPARKEYDGFPGYPIQPLAHQIKAIEIISGKPVVAITINHELIPSDQIQSVCEKVKNDVGLPAYDVLLNGADELVKLIEKYIKT
jgi:uncharacterized NAD-dependent epimerase/dehydratase family protein